MDRSAGEALAGQLCVRFFETSSKSGENIDHVIATLARDIKRRMVGLPSLKHIKLETDGTSVSPNLAQPPAVYASV